MTRIEAKKAIEELSDKINYYNDQYYQDHNSVITDYEFDQLLARLIKLEDEFPDLKSDHSPTQRVGGTITKSFETVVHKSPMLSLGNTYSPEELLEFDQRVAKGLGEESYEYFCELKFDGVAISLTYENGVLIQAVTRGDGTRGDNITANAKTIRSIPLLLNNNDHPSLFEVRGEVFMPLPAFKALNQEREDIGEVPLANPRNTTSGTLKMQDSRIVASRKLDCYIYSLLGDSIPDHTHQESIWNLEKWGFNISPTYQKCATIDQVLKYIQKWERKRLELPLETDGIVVKINDYQQRQRLGFTSKNPRWAISFKYKTENAETKLLGIGYQVGRTGAVTPVAHLEPVVLAGTTVKRASLHNANEISRLDVRIGDTVFVEKGGEIIPKVTGVKLKDRDAGSQPVEYLENCPECGTPLVRNENEAVHFCPNEKNCPPQIKGRIQHFIQRNAMDINSLGEQTIRLLYEQNLVRTPADLYRLTYEDSYELEGFKDLSTKNLLAGIEESKSIPFPNVLFALGIRYVGKTVAEKLADHFNDIQNLQEANYDELIAVPEIGERIAQSVLDFFKDQENREIVQHLKKVGVQLRGGSTIQSDSNSLEGKSFVVSGVFSNYGRDEIKQLIKRNGGKVLSSVSGKLDYLVAGDKMGPAKLQKAEKLGIQIVSESDLEAMINSQ